MSAFICRFLHQICDVLTCYTFRVENGFGHAYIFITVPNPREFSLC